MAVITTTHTDPDEKAAQEGYDRTVVVIRDKGNEIGSSVLQVRFFQSITDFALGINANDIATGASNLGATAPVSTPIAALGSSTGTSAPPSGIADLHGLGVGFEKLCTEIGVDANVGLKIFTDLANAARTKKAIGKPDDAMLLLRAATHVANTMQVSDLEADGTPKIIAAHAALKTERDAAVAAKTAAESNLAAVTHERDDLKAKLGAIKTKWTALKTKLVEAIDGDKFKKNHASPNAEINEVTTAIG
jgi:hypothetical protein